MMRTLLTPVGVHASPQTILDFVRQAFRHSSAVLVGLSIMLGVLRWVDMPIVSLAGKADRPLAAKAATAWHFGQLLAAETAAFCLLAAVLLAEQSVRAGASRWKSYSASIVIAAACSGAISAMLVQLLKDWNLLERRLPEVPIWRHMIFTGFDALSRGGIAAFVYSNHQQMQASMKELQTAELERAQTRADLAASQLQAMQTLVDPKFLFTQLEAIREQFPINPQAADQSLEQLVEHLRGMMPTSRL